MSGPLQMPQPSGDQLKRNGASPLRVPLEVGTSSGNAGSHGATPILLPRRCNNPDSSWVPKKVATASPLARLQKAQSVHNLMPQGAEPDEIPASGSVLSREMETQEGLGSLTQADGRSSQPCSFQSPTNSSMAKIARSISVGENLGLAAEPQASSPLRVSPLSKLTLPGRAHLVLDIPKPLPDRPTLPTFSPVTKGRAPGDIEQHGSQEGLGKGCSPVDRQACGGEGAIPKPRAEYQAHLEPSSPGVQRLPVSSLFQGPESFQPPSPEKTPNSLECTRPGSSLSQDSEAAVNLEQCEQLVAELRGKVRQAVGLYHLVASCKTPSAEQSQITQLLRDTFSSVRQELEILAGTALSSPGSSPGAVGAEQTQALLEQYSELLLRAVERRMERKL